MSSAAQPRVALTGNEAIAQAMRQINPDVVAAYPITPQTEIVQMFSSFVADGEVDTEFVRVESEHSAMSAVIGSAAAGARAMTATSANGLALMWEMVYIAASYRLPIVMPVVNRALSGPINIHCDHSDSMGARDSGWIQLYSENAQESYDNVIQAIRIAEHPDVQLPVMVCMDGFIISHALDNLHLMTDDAVREFIGNFEPAYSLLDVDNPITVGPLDLQDWYFEHKRQQVEGSYNALEVIPEIGREYGKVSGREYGFFEEYRTEDAEGVIVVLGSTAGTAKDVIDAMRADGHRVGLLKLRVFRPLPVNELIRVLAGRPAVSVMDRSDTFSTAGGPVYHAVRHALYDCDERPQVRNYVYGLGGRDVRPGDIRRVLDETLEVASSGRIARPITYLGVRE
ncbi:MAG: pyruvate ferredoxin oxidoreductase [Bacillota bacterium]